MIRTLDPKLKKAIEEKGWMPLQKQSDYDRPNCVRLGECEICGNYFSEEIKKVSVLKLAFPNQFNNDNVCSNKICQDKFYIKPHKCFICKKEFLVDNRYVITTTDYNHFELCSEKCLMKYNTEMMERIIIKEISYTLPLKYREIESDKDVKKFLNKSLYIYGPAGTGKSVLMASITKQYIRNYLKEKDYNDYELGFTEKNTRFIVLWVSMTEFMMELQSCYHNSSGDPYNIAQRVAEYKDILCLDDLGACKTTEFVQQIIYYILNHREENCLKTIITSNLPLSKIDNITGERISSRIAGMCEVVEMKGDDRRINK